MAATFTMAPSRLAEVNRMLAAETERLQEAVKQIQTGHAGLPRQDGAQVMEPVAMPAAQPRMATTPRAAAMATTPRAAAMATSPRAAAAPDLAGACVPCAALAVPGGVGAGRRSPLAPPPAPLVAEGKFTPTSGARFDRPQVEFALGELTNSHLEAQNTVRHLQTELSMAEASLRQAQAERQGAQTAEERALRQQAEAFDMELRRQRSESRAQLDALEASCDQLRKANALEQGSRAGLERSYEAELQQLRGERRSCEADLANARAELQEAELREQRVASDSDRAYTAVISELEQLRGVLQRLQAERDADARSRESIRAERDGLLSKATALHAQVERMRAAEESERQARETAERSGRAWSEEKLRLHADRGQLREARQQAEQELQAEAQAAREAQHLCRMALSAEEALERRLAEVTQAGNEAQQALAAERARARSRDDGLRAEMATERREVEPAQLRLRRELEEERRLRTDSERRLAEAKAEIDAMLAERMRLRSAKHSDLSASREALCAREGLEGENAALRGALQETRDAEVAREAAAVQERSRWAVERRELRDAEARAARVVADVERQRDEAVEEAERLSVRLGRLQVAWSEERRGIVAEKSQLERDLKALSKEDEAFRRMRLDEKDMQLKLQLVQEEKCRLEDECRRLRAVAGSRSPVAEAPQPSPRRSPTASRRQGSLSARGPARPGAAPDWRAQDPRRVRLQDPQDVEQVEFSPVSSLHSAGHRGPPCPHPGAQSLLSRLHGPPQPSRSAPPRGASKSRAIAESLRLLPADLKARLSASTSFPLDALGDTAGPRATAMLVQLYVVMSEMLNLPDAMTRSLPFQRLLRHLEEVVGADEDLASSDGTRSPRSPRDD